MNCAMEHERQSNGAPDNTGAELSVRAADFRVQNAADNLRPHSKSNPFERAIHRGRAVLKGNRRNASSPRPGTAPFSNHCQSLADWAAQYTRDVARANVRTDAARNHQTHRQTATQQNGAELWSIVGMNSYHRPSSDHSEHSVRPPPGSSRNPPVRSRRTFSAGSVVIADTGWTVQPRRTACTQFCGRASPRITSAALGTRRAERRDRTGSGGHFQTAFNCFRWGSSPLLRSNRHRSAGKLEPRLTNPSVGVFHSIRLVADFHSVDAGWRVVPVLGIAREISFEISPANPDKPRTHVHQTRGNYSEGLTFEIAFGASKSPHLRHGR